MPRRKQAAIRPPAERIALAEYLRRQYGGALTFQDLMDALGYKDKKAVQQWIRNNGVEAVVLNGRKKYLAIDVARILDNSKIMGTAM